MEPTTLRVRSRSSLLKSSLIIVIFVLLAALFTWPLPLHLRTRVIGPFHGDNLEYVWKTWWVKHALLDLRQSPLVQPDIYYPYGYPLSFGEITPIHTYLGLPLTAAFGPVAAYNIFVLSSVLLSGFFAYLYVYHLTGSAPAGMVSGILFAFCPYRMARIAGHLPLVDTQWLPLLLLFLDRFLCRRRWTDAALSGILFAASTLSSWYYGVALVLLIPVYVFARWDGKAWKDMLRGALAFALPAILLILPFLLPYRSIQQAGAAIVPLEQAAFWSASLTDYLLPNPRHALWGKWVQEHLTLFPEGLPYEFMLGWGLVASVLGLYGWRYGRAQVGRAWQWWTGVALVLSLGPILKLLGKPILIPAPTWLVDTVQGVLDWLGRHSWVNEAFTLAPAGHIALPLPALLLRWFVPGLGGMRAWGRLAIFAVLGIAIWAGAGTASFLRREVEHRPARRPLLRRWGVTGALAVAILFELYTGPQQLITPGPRGVDHWLAALPEKTTIIQMPLAVALSGPQMFYSMYHGQRVASGYGTYLPILFEAQYPELETFPSNAALDLLAGWGGTGVNWVLIDEAHVPADDPLWSAVAGQSRMERVAVIDGVSVYRVR